MRYNNKYFDNIYLHDVNYKYPHVDEEHMVKYPKYHNYVYDKYFPYRLKDKKNKFITSCLHILIIVIAIPVVRFRYFFYTKGKKNVREYHRLTKQKGMISICNHTEAMDFIMVSAIRHKVPIIPMWQEGVESKKGMFFRRAVGLAVPRHDIKGLAYSFREMEKVLDEGKWLHIYPEAASWPMYPCLRKFQNGAFILAQKYDLPILPLGVKFREPKGLYRLFKTKPLAMLTVGKPLLINKNLPSEEAVEDLRIRSHDAVLNLLGFKNEEENNLIRQKIYAIQK